MTAAPYLIVLGITQDGGYPQAGCDGPCCASARLDPQRQRYPTSVAVVDPSTEQRWLFDCTPRFPEQLALLNRVTSTTSPDLAGIFLTHAHIGHYTGLLHLGREVLNVHSVPVYTMPRMQQFLSTNAPWRQLIELGNIRVHTLQDGVALPLTDQLTITPLTVPHRGEYSETVAFHITGPQHSVLYLPDIDSWEPWESHLTALLPTLARAYLDGTFFSADELPGRDLSQIPHPLITDSLRRFSSLPLHERDKLHFFHFNHSNPALQKGSFAAKQIDQAGHHTAVQGELFLLDT